MMIKAIAAVFIGVTLSFMSDLFVVYVNYWNFGIIALGIGLGVAIDMCERIITNVFHRIGWV